jgi:hypothetical protein
MRRLSPSNRRREPRRGAAMIEFTLAGIASVTLLVSTIQLALAMWNYHTLAQATHDLSRYVSLHGKGCTIAGNACTITVGDIATKFKTIGIGLPANSVQMTLVTDSGATTNCNPLNTCFGNTTVWPPATNKDYLPGKNITVRARYSFQSAILLIWPGTSGQKFGAISLPASSTQKILF